MHTYWYVVSPSQECHGGIHLGYTNDQYIDRKCKTHDNWHQCASEYWL
jgi:hypothetical protein